MSIKEAKSQALSAELIVDREAFEDGWDAAVEYLRTHHRVVPIEPTQKMVNAAYNVYGLKILPIYQAMIAAAPEPEDL